MMLPIRVLFGTVGAGVLGYGAWLLWAQVSWEPGFVLSLGGWLVAGPVLHDWVLTPVTTLGGVLLARTLPRPWRTTVIAGLVTTGVLLLVGIPLLTRPMPAAPNPGLDDRDYLPGLLLYLAVLWVLLLGATAGYATLVAARRRGPNAPGAGGR
ncbi:hypothetical protein AB0J90_12630 [Micromonospora sp. NPDC049523]|uniref:hypothetical protein n=1 Tax=Micromonospora sp. NPDC049523 TaxID=3155921 RepID=UPI0034443497